MGSPRGDHYGKWASKASIVVLMQFFLFFLFVQSALAEHGVERAVVENGDVKENISGSGGRFLRRRTTKSEKKSSFGDEDQEQQKHQTGSVEFQRDRNSGYNNNILMKENDGDVRSERHTEIEQQGKAAADHMAWNESINSNSDHIESFSQRFQKASVEDFGKRDNRHRNLQMDGSQSRTLQRGGTVYNYGGFGNNQYSTAYGSYGGYAEPRRYYAQSISPPSFAPTRAPTRAPTDRPTETPTVDPTKQPTQSPVANPTAEPTKQPTVDPTTQPTGSPVAPNPTAEPTKRPTGNPTRRPTLSPTKEPTLDPTTQPSQDPTTQPTRNPTRQPMRSPTREPTRSPARQPTQNPTNDTVDNYYGIGSVYNYGDYANGRYSSTYGGYTGPQQYYSANTVSVPPPFYGRNRAQVPASEPTRRPPRRNANLDLLRVDKYLII